MARAQGARAQMALAFETIYGTPPAGGFTRMPFASTTLGAEQPLLASELLGYGRDPLAPIKDAVTADGDVVIPIDAASIGFWLKAAFGAPVTTGTEPPCAHVDFDHGPPGPIPSRSATIVRRTAGTSPSGQSISTRSARSPGAMRPRSARPMACAGFSATRRQSRCSGATPSARSRATAPNIAG